MAALKTGEATFVEPSLEEAAALNKDPKFKVYAAKRSGQQVFAAFTWQIPPLDNPLVRQAVGYALDRAMYAEIGFEGLVQPAFCPMAPGLLASDQEQCREWGQSYDPEMAKKMLAQAGYGPEKPIDVVLSVHKLPGWDRMHQIMQQHLKAIGINAKIETREVAAFFDHMKGENKRTDGPPAIWTMGMSGVDPDYLYFLWHRPGFCNMGLNAEMDKMLEEQRTLIGDQRKQKLDEISKYLLTKAYAIPLVSPGWNWLLASPANVEGFKIGYVSALILNDVQFN
jgi:peptide/nickel transport system substrate-binding protein